VFLRVQHKKYTGNTKIYGLPESFSRVNHKINTGFTHFILLVYKISDTVLKFKMICAQKGKILLSIILQVNIQDTRLYTAPMTNAFNNSSYSVYY
jgi:hypothetical protein